MSLLRRKSAVKRETVRILRYVSGTAANAGKGQRNTFFGIDFTKRRTDLTGLQIVPPHKSHGLRIEKKLPGTLARTH